MACAPLKSALDRMLNLILQPGEGIDTRPLFELPIRLQWTERIRKRCMILCQGNKARAQGLERIRLCNVSSLAPQWDKCGVVAS